MLSDGEPSASQSLMRPSLDLRRLPSDPGWAGRRTREHRDWALTSNRQQRERGGLRRPFHSSNPIPGQAAFDIHPSSVSSKVNLSLCASLSI